MIYIKNYYPPVHDDKMKKISGNPYLTKKEDKILIDTLLIDDLLEITEKYFDITGEIHLQDYVDDNLYADHGALGMGKKFPPEFLNLIYQKDFKGPVVFELPRKDIITSIEYIKNNVPQIIVPHIK